MEINKEHSVALQIEDRNPPFESKTTEDAFTKSKELQKDRKRNVICKKRKVDSQPT